MCRGYRPKWFRSGTGAGGEFGGPRAAIFDGTTLLSGDPARLVNDFFAFPGDDATTLRNGVFVAAGDVNGDGKADLVFGGGPGGAPRVEGFSGPASMRAGTATGVVINQFAGDPTARGGVRVTTGDWNGDGFADLMAAVDGAGGPSTPTAGPMASR